VVMALRWSLALLLLLYAVLGWQPVVWVVP
jgi:hypothetical protein